MSGARVPAWLRQQVADEAQHRCGYCLMAERVVGMPRELDHLIPEALGGGTEAENLWLACPGCNARKAERVLGIVCLATSPLANHTRLCATMRIRVAPQDRPKNNFGICRFAPHPTPLRILTRTKPCTL